MNAPFIVAQAITSGQSTSQATSRTTVKLTKPANGQAVSVQLDANTQLDFSAIASDQITLVRVGNQLVILFDNQTTVTIAPFFDANGNPLDNVAIDLGSRIVDGQEFAGLFPITTDQSILPASGSAGGGGDGFGASDPSVDALNTGNPLDLLGNEEGTPVTFTINEALGRDNDVDTGPVDPAPTAFSQTVTIDEDGDGSAGVPIFPPFLADAVPGGPGDDPDAQLVYIGGSASGTQPLFDFGPDGPAAVDPVVFDLAALNAQALALGLTSGGEPVTFAYNLGLTNSIIATVPSGAVVLIAGADPLTGDFGVGILRPLDHAPPSDGVAFENEIVLEFPFTLTDGNGTQTTGTLTVNVDDDSPDPCNPVPGFVEEGVSPLLVTIDLDLEWGADNFNPTGDEEGPRLAAIGQGDRSITFASMTAGDNVVARDADGNLLPGLTSSGETILFTILPPAFPGALVYLVAYVEQSPGIAPTIPTDPSVVFWVSLSDLNNGDAAFELRGPLDHPAPSSTPVTMPDGSIEFPHAIDLSFLFTAFDSDGDGVSGGFTVRVDAAGIIRPSLCGCWSEVDYSGLAGGVFINLSDSSRTVGTETADARTAQDREGVTPVIGKDQLGTDVLDAIGTDSDDIIIGGAEDNTLEGLGGDDLIRGGDGMDWIEGGAGADDLRGGRGSDFIEGDDGDDTIRGGRGDDFIFGDDLSGAGAGGNDTIYGGRGDDVIDGGVGDDTIRGGRGDDDIFGGAGDDIIRGGRGDDYIEGNGDNDTIIYNVGDGADLVFGGGGDDVQEIYGTGDSETFNVNRINLGGDNFVGINIRDGIDVPDDVRPATVDNFEVATRGVEDIYIDTGFGPDAVIITGPLGGTGLAQSTITIDGGSDNSSDIVDAAGLTSNHGIVFNGGGGDDLFFLSGADGVDTFDGGTGIDSAIYSCLASAATFGFDGTHWTITVNGVTDTIIGVEAVEFADESFLLVDHYGQDIGGFQTIQEAVDYSCGCQTVLIAPGTYNEDVTINNNDVSLMGLESTRTTIITGQITITGTLDGDVTLSNLRIDATLEEYGVFADASSTAFGGEINLANVLIEKAEKNGFAYILAGNGSDPTETETVGAISIVNSEFTGNGGAAGDTRGDILIYGFNGDLTIDTVSIHDAAAGADKAIQVRGVEEPGVDLPGIGPYASFGDVSITNLTITGTYGQDLVAFYNIADFASFVATNVTLNANAPWGLFNIDSVGGTVDLSGVSGTNGASPPGGGTPIIVVAQGLASGDAFTGTDGRDVFLGRGGDDNLSGGAGNDTFFYAAGGGRDIVNGGLEGVGGKDVLDITGTSADENFFIEIPADYNTRVNPDYAGSAEILVSSGDDILVEASEIEDIVIHGGGGADTLTVSGSFTGTSLLTSTITFDSGAGNDTLDLTNRQSAHRVVADGSSGTDTVLYDFTRASVTSVTEIFDTDGTTVIGANITFDTPDGPVTDVLKNFESFTFSDGTYDLTNVFNLPPDAVDDTLAGLTQYVFSGTVNAWDEGAPWSSDYTFTLFADPATRVATSFGYEIPLVASAMLSLPYFSSDAIDIATPVRLGYNTTTNRVFFAATGPGHEDAYTIALTEPHESIFLNQSTFGPLTGTAAQFNFIGLRDIIGSDLPPRIVFQGGTVTAEVSASVAGYAEDTAFTIATSVLTANDSDPEGNPITFVSVQDAIGGIVSLSGGTITFVPAADYTGAASFTYTIQDSLGLTDTATVSFNIYNVNDAPVIAGDLAATVAEGGTVLITAADLGEADLDDAGAGLTYTVTPSNGQVLVNGNVATSFTAQDVIDGRVSFRHDGSETTSASFTFTLADGGENGSTPASGTFNLTVTPVNDTPVIAGDLAATVARGASAVITAADLGEADPDDAGAGLTYTVTSQTNGDVLVNGSVANTFTAQDVIDGRVSFRHDGSQTTGASFGFTLADGGEDGSTSASGLVTLAVNNPPDAVDDTLAASEDTPFTIAASTLTGNDSDPDGNPVTLVSVQGATGGTVSLSGGNITFVPTANYFGAASFTYTIRDPLGETDTATVNLNIAPVNDAPRLDLDGDNSSGMPGPGYFTVATTGGAGVGIADSDVVLSDVDDTHLEGLTVSISNHQLGDFLTTNPALIPDGITFVAGQSSFGHLVFTGHATLADYQTLIRNITFHTTSSDTTLRSIAVTVNDGGDPATAASLVGVNQAPVITAAPGGSLTEDVNVTPGANMIANGNFESGLAGWSAAGNAGLHDYNNMHFSTRYLINQGRYSAFLSEGAQFGIPDGSLSQTFQTNAGTQYFLSYAMLFHSSAVFDVTLNGQVVQHLTFDGGFSNTYQQYGYSFIGTGGAVTLGFAVDVNAANGVVLDSMNLYAMQQSTSGTVAFTDANASDVHSASYVAQGTGYIGTFSLGSVDQDDNNVGWNFVADSSQMQALRGGEVRTQTYAVTVSDGRGGTDIETVTVTLHGVNDAPVITSNDGNALAVNAAENQTSVTTVVASDVDLGTTLTWTLSGTDAALFNISNTGVITFKNAPNYEAPSDSGANNVYDLIATVSDGTLTDTQAVAVTVTNGNDAPAITSVENGSVTEDAGASASGPNLVFNGSFSSFTLAPQSPAPGLIATLPGWTHQGTVLQADLAHFVSSIASLRINGLTSISQNITTEAGQRYQLSFYADGPTSEITQAWFNGGFLIDAKSLLATDPFRLYTVEFEGTGGPAALRFTQPGFGSSNLDDVAVRLISPPAQQSDSGTIGYSDPEGGVPTATVAALGTGYVGTLSIGAIDGNSVEWNFAADNSALQFLRANQTVTQTYAVTLTDSQGANTTQNVSVQLHGVNDAVTITSNNGDPLAVSVVEGNIAVAAIVASDVDVGDVFTWSLSGTDAALFDISNTGVLTFKTAPDFEAPVGGDNTYNVTVQVSDGTVTDTQAVSVTVTDVNDAPVNDPGPDFVITNVGAAAVYIPEEYLLENDIDVFGFKPFEVTAVGGAVGGTVSFDGSIVTFTDDATLGGLFTYTGIEAPAPGTVTVTNVASSTLTGGNAGELMFGGSGDDLIVGNGGRDWVYGNDGNDVIRGGAGSDKLYGGAGIDMLDLSDAVQRTEIGVVFDGIYIEFRQSAAINIFDQLQWSGLGRDEYYAMEGVIGSSFNDYIAGQGTANDIFWGGAGIDTIYGGGGDDIIRGGFGNEVDQFGIFNDNLDGQGGIDLLDLSEASGAVSFTLTQSSSVSIVDLSSVGLGYDRYYNFEGVIGSAYGDNLTGSGLADILQGGAGNDTLRGGAGIDQLTGGTGADNHVFAETGAANRDTILDYSFAEGDKLDLSGLLDANFGNGSQEGHFVKLLQSGGNTTVQVDTNGPVGGFNYVDVAVLQGYTGSVKAVFENVEHTLTA